MKHHVLTWIEQERARLRTSVSHTYFSSIHIDDLLGSDYRDDKATQLGLGVLVTCGHLLEGLDDLRPRLAIALPSSSNLDIALPDIRAIEYQRDAFQPPELYLFRNNLEYLTGGHEEYRAAYIDVPPTDVFENSHVEASYTTYRDQVSRVNGWDFSRTIWFDVRAAR